MAVYLARCFLHTRGGNVHEWQVDAKGDNRADFDVARMPRGSFSSFELVFLRARWFSFFFFLLSYVSFFFLHLPAARRYTVRYRMIFPARTLRGSTCLTLGFPKCSRYCRRDCLPVTASSRIRLSRRTAGCWMETDIPTCFQCCVRIVECIGWWQDATLYSAFDFTPQSLIRQIFVCTCHRINRFGLHVWCSNFEVND